jgi:AraC-like DNA-binding protein/DNA gyrase inhibitor GyrI
LIKKDIFFQSEFDMMELRAPTLTGKQVEMETVHAVQSAIDFMEDHLYEPLTFDQIADAAYMSLPNLYRSFYALTGHPLKEYMRKRRTHQAAITIRVSDLSVLEIAYACGFESYEAFIKCFKKYTGLTPGTYRKAAIYFSFERINLLENVVYKEDRSLSERYPDVKVIRMEKTFMLTYLHASTERAGLEEEAFRHFTEKLKRIGIPLAKARVYGSNVEDIGQPDRYLYQIMTPVAEAFSCEATDLHVLPLEGSLYAVGRSPAGTPDSILSAWNQLLAEWLPKSTFALGPAAFMEEFLHDHGKPYRMKLLLPVIRKTQQPNIERKQLPSFSFLSFRTYGPTSVTLSDEWLNRWLLERGFAGDQRIQLFMSWSYGLLSGEEYWYELGISLPTNYITALEDQDRIKHWQEGEYACLTAYAYGAMTGVLDQLYSWVSHNEFYTWDESRQWFAKYIPGETSDLERTTKIECCIPIRRCE